MTRLRQSFCLPCFCPMEDLGEIRRVVEAAARAGFAGCELWGPDPRTFKEIHQIADGCGLRLASMCGHTTLQSGLNQPENHPRIREELKSSIAQAHEYGVPNLICFSGNRSGRGDEEALAITADGLAQVKELAERAGITLNLELLNSKIDHPGYQCDRSAWGAEVVRRVGSPRVKLLYDIYHMQIMEGDLCRTIRALSGAIGHFHTAGNPGRHDPDETQEIYYPALARAIRDSGYAGFVAHEFWPRGDRLQALLQAYRLFDI